jgi:hypothetical protein
VDQTSEHGKVTQRFKRRLIAYIDILGWSELTNRGEDKRIRETFASIERINAEEKRQLRHVVGRFGPVGSTGEQSSFSDSIAYSCLEDDWEVGWMVRRVQWLCSELLIAGHCTRGALCFGELEHTDRMIAGKALIEAHRIEREVAKYPRLILSSEAERVVTSAGSWRKQAQIRHDRDGLPFLDIVGISEGGTRSRHERRIAELCADACRRELDRTREAGDSVRGMNHRAKYGWMLSYLEGVLSSPAKPNDTSIPRER